MTHTRLWVAATIIAGIILVGFIVSVPHTRDIPGQKQAPATSVEAPSVSVRDIYRKGMHTFTGSVAAPNPCTTATVAAALTGASTSQSILLSISMPQDGGICLQQVTPVPFSATLAAPAGLPITATVNGATATVTAL